MSKPVTIGIAMGAAALGMALGYYSQPSTPVAMACDPLVLAPAPVREAEPVKDDVQQVMPAKPIAPQMMDFIPNEIPQTQVTAAVAVQVAKGNAKPLDPIMGIVLQSHGHNCAWIHRTTYGEQWIAESLVHWGNMQAFKGGTTYEQAVRLTKEGWCGK